jgi:fructose-1,6-bisphosphatase/inositol monophosphatase family enzyme
MVTVFKHPTLPAVSVGVLHRSTPVAGCVIEFTGGPHAWATRTFTAHLGGGAFCNGTPIRVSEVPSVNCSLLVGPDCPYPPKAVMKDVHAVQQKQL